MTPDLTHWSILLACSKRSGISKLPFFGRMLCSMNRRRSSFSSGCISFIERIGTNQEAKRRLQNRGSRWLTVELMRNAQKRHDPWTEEAKSHGCKDLRSCHFHTLKKSPLRGF